MAHNMMCLKPVKYLLLTYMGQTRVFPIFYKMKWLRCEIRHSKVQLLLLLMLMIRKEYPLTIYGNLCGILNDNFCHIARYKITKSNDFSLYKITIILYAMTKYLLNKTTFIEDYQQVSHSSESHVYANTKSNDIFPNKYLS